MRLMTDDPHKLFSPESAIAAADELNSQDEDWDYRAKHDPAGTGYSFIEIYDENGEYVGRF